MMDSVMRITYNEKLYKNKLVHVSYVNDMKTLPEPHDRFASISDFYKYLKVLKFF